MESNTRLKLSCYICQSAINVKIDKSFVEVYQKFQIYTTKYLNFSSCSQEKTEVRGQAISNTTGDNDHSKNKFTACCVQCAKEIETFCEMWETLESFQGEMIRAVVNISNITKSEISSQSQSLPHCFICQAAPTSNSVCGKSSEIETCLKFITFVTRFVLNSKKPGFDKKILQIFVQMGNICNSVFIFCCKNCQKEVSTFCEMYEALDSIRLEILRILDRISNRSQHFQFSVENCRKQSFPRVRLERLPSIVHKPDQIQMETETKTKILQFTEAAEFESDLQAESGFQPDDDNFESIEMGSTGIPSPSWSLCENKDVDDNADTTELSPAKPVNIFQTSPVTMNTIQCKNRPKRKRYPHSYTHVSRYKGACFFCEKLFPLPTGLENHMRSHTGERGFICRICLREFSQKQALLRHRRSRHSRKKNTPIPKVCEICGKSFKIRRNLIQHIQSVHQKLRPHKCEICGKMFATKGSLRYHKRAMHAEGESSTKTKEICHICGKTVRSHGNSFLRHLNEQHRSEIDDSLKLEKRFKCSVAGCPRAFYDSTDLRRHMLIHTGERKFQCDECGKAFPLQWKLKIHKEIHKEFRPYVCAHCGKGFNYKFRLVHHVKKYHSSENNVNSDDVIGS